MDTATENMSRPEHIVAVSMNIRKTLKEWWDIFVGMNTEMDDNDDHDKKWEKIGHGMRFALIFVVFLAAPTAMYADISGPAGVYAEGAALNYSGEGPAYLYIYDFAALSTPYCGGLMSVPGEIAADMCGFAVPVGEYHFVYANAVTCPVSSYATCIANNPTAVQNSDFEVEGGGGGVATSTTATTTLVFMYDPAAQIFYAFLIFLASFAIMIFYFRRV